MGKTDNRKAVATPMLRRLFSDIRAGRLHEREWKKYNETRKDELIAEAGEVDVTFITEAGEEVGSITESGPSSRIDWARFQDDHPELAGEIEKYRKPATTEIRVLTQWVEPDQPALPPR